MFDFLKWIVERLFETVSGRRHLQVLVHRAFFKGTGRACYLASIGFSRLSDATYRVSRLLMLASSSTMRMRVTCQHLPCGRQSPAPASGFIYRSKVPSASAIT